MVFRLFSFSLEGNRPIEHQCRHDVVNEGDDGADIAGAASGSDAVGGDERPLGGNQCRRHILDEDGTACGARCAGQGGELGERVEH